MGAPLGPLSRAIASLANRESLTEDQAAEVFGVVMRGEAGHTQAAALLMGLRVKGETAAEVAGAARALREAMVRVSVAAEHLVDTAGTGGGAVGTFNISTGAALVAAGAGATVAKHGNRSFTSLCGSADVFEALGVDIGLGAERAAQLLRVTRIAFLFAPNYHPAMRHIAPVRRELGVTTLMNLLGPLANPAQARRQVLGVADRDRAPLVAAAAARLGALHVLVVNARIGMDEISPSGVTDVWEVRGSDIRQWTVDPAAHGLAVDDPAALSGGTPAENASRLTRLLTEASGEADRAGIAALLLNAAAALYASGVAASFAEGIERSRDAVRDGSAYRALEGLRRAAPRQDGQGGASTSG